MVLWLPTQYLGAYDGTIVQKIVVETYKKYCYEVINKINELVPNEYILDKGLDEKQSNIETSESIISTQASTIEKRENTDFRNTCWGDDIETVKKYETEAVLAEENETELIYEGKINTYDTYIIYNFNNNKLFESVYGLNLNYTNAGQYIPVYNSLKTTLKEIYGEPYEDKIFSLADQTLIDSAGSANALSFGYVTYRAQWKTERSNIMIGMQAENFKVTLLIAYDDIKYKEDVSKSGL